MTVEQLPDQVREFAGYLQELLARLDQGGGWCGVFWQRDPDGMAACLDGREVPPWDVVQALLHDLAADAGPAVAEGETARAGALHAASVRAHDARPGAREILADRLDIMLREQRYAAERGLDLGELLAAAAPDRVEGIHLELAWARDDQERATARCAELRARMAELDRRVGYVGTVWPESAAAGWGGGPTAWSGGEAMADPDRAPGPAVRPDPGPVWPQAAATAREGGPGAWPEGEADRGPAPDPQPLAQVPAQVPAQAPPPEEPRRRKPPRRPRGARFAGLESDDAAADEVPVVPVMPLPPPTDDTTPRGARFSGGTPAGDNPRRAPQPLDDEAPRATAQAVADLVRLRGQGRSGEAHAVLCEAARWPAPRLPLLAAELHRAGLGADWATLLWEAASLPPDRLVAAADALAAAGRTEDCRGLLRQGVARPAPDIADAVLALDEAGREREAAALLDAYLRVRTPEEAARIAETDPDHLVPRLLTAAHAVSPEHHWDLMHALRVAGLTA